MTSVWADIAYLVLAMTVREWEEDREVTDDVMCCATLLNAIDYQRRAVGRTK